MTEFTVVSWEKTPLGLGRPEPWPRRPTFTGDQAEDLVTHPSSGSQREHKGRNFSPEVLLGFKLLCSRILKVLALYLLPNSGLA